MGRNVHERPVLGCHPVASLDEAALSHHRPGLLDETLLPCVEAALHRAEWDFPAALELERIEDALALDNGEPKGQDPRHPGDAGQ
jgi:hypothetical protein